MHIRALPRWLQRELEDVKRDTSRSSRPSHSSYDREYRGRDGDRDRDRDRRSYSKSYHGSGSRSPSPSRSSNRARSRSSSAERRERIAKWNQEREER